jgi:hypothetical protein
MLRIPRSRGAVSGLLLVILGLWGGLIPFVGPYFDFAIGPNRTWHWSTGRLWLDVLPGAAAVVGGLMLMASRNRASGGLGAWIALAAGVWFVIGPSMSMLWNNGGVQTGLPFGGTGRRTLEELTYFYGLGAAITTLSAFAMGRLSVVSARDMALAGRRQPAAAAPTVGAGAAPTVGATPAPTAGATPATTVGAGAATPAGAGAPSERRRERKRERRFFRRGHEAPAKKTAPSAREPVGGDRATNKPE